MLRCIYNLINLIYSTWVDSMGAEKRGLEASLPRSRVVTSTRLSRSSTRKMTETNALPENLPFTVGQTIGRGAFASIKLCEAHSSKDIIAVKFIHKQYALEDGRLAPQQLLKEVQLHKRCGHDSVHANVIRFFGSHESDTWRWIAMEYASGGDLFDKIGIYKTCNLAEFRSGRGGGRRYCTFLFPSVGSRGFFYPLSRRCSSRYAICTPTY